MEFGPILRSMKRNKVRYGLIVAEFALTLAVVEINGWNRLAISFRTEAGTYQPRTSSAAPENEFR